MRNSSGTMAKFVILGILAFPAHPARGGTPGLREAFRRVNPSVVVVRTTQSHADLPEAKSTAEDWSGLGSGILVSKDGKVLTAAHVVQSADRIEVQFMNGNPISARVISTAPFADVALLQIDHVPDTAVTAALGDSDQAAVGDQVLVIGAPYGMTHSMSVGHVSARHAIPKVCENLAALELLQTDAAIYEGNSGGPVCNLSGEVIGIVTHVVAKANQVAGPAMAVTSNVARKLLIDSRRFWIGVEVYLLEGKMAEAFNLPQPAGLLVQSVAAGSPAARTGMREGTIRMATGEAQMVLVGGDIILEMAGVSVTEDTGSCGELQNQLDRLKTGQRANVRVLRAGKVVELSLEVTRD